MGKSKSVKMVSLVLFCAMGFVASPAQTVQTLATFSVAKGYASYAAFARGTNGRFYGTTADAGAHGHGAVFEITAAGNMSILYSFCAQANCVDGDSPVGLIQATNGNFYGTTSLGGTFGGGTVFEISLAGTMTTLHSFGSPDGTDPAAGLIQAAGGNFFGTTEFGGQFGFGTVFTLSMGLGPFVETRPSSAKVGAKVIILGNKLTGATSVSFNGTAATFKVVSGTEITATVPSGATTGTVQVKVPSGTLKSNIAFHVNP